MESIYASFINKKPRCFNDFELEDVQGADSPWAKGCGPEYLTKLVRCACGNCELNIYASSGSGMNLAPIHIECPNCNYKAEVFNPENHGHDGELGHYCSFAGREEAKKITESPIRLVVEYSYQGEENYKELLEEGIENLEDYFDVFAIYTMDNSGNLKEVVSYECA